MTDWTEEADAAWLAAASAMTTPLRREAMVAALKAAHKRGVVDGLKDVAGWALQQKRVFQYACERIAELEAE